MRFAQEIARCAHRRGHGVEHLGVVCSLFGTQQRACVVLCLAPRTHVGLLQGVGSVPYDTHKITGARFVRLAVERDVDDCRRCLRRGHWWCRSIDLFCRVIVSSVEEIKI